MCPKTCPIIQNDKNMKFLCPKTDKGCNLLVNMNLWGGVVWVKWREPLTSNVIVILLRVDRLWRALWLLRLVDGRGRLRSRTITRHHDWRWTHQSHRCASSMTHHVNCATVLIVERRLQNLWYEFTHVYTVYDWDLYNYIGMGIVCSRRNQSQSLTLF